MRRREFVLTAASLATAALWLDPARAQSQGASNLVSRQGEVLLNGRPLASDGVIQTGDTVATGPDGRVAFSIGNDAFLLRPNTTLNLERGASLFAVSGARLIAGAFAAVFGPSRHPRAITSRTVTAGIRGTGFYVGTEVESTYFCTCYGSIELSGANGARELVNSRQHAARRVFASPTGGRVIVPAPLEFHDDAEIERLAALVNQRPAWRR
ncbi:MAG: iron dicitrate transport regulator FecR [Burkholderiales bacterium]|nr:iron dicitrate transport regulator FecR [Burkholderiales bacterium]